MEQEERSNPYLTHLHRLEFVVTWACTGKCKHCSVGNPTDKTSHLTPDVAARVVREICAHYPLSSVMTFGGEPLLYPETVCAVHRTARDCGVEKRQVITNGNFSKEAARIREVARMMAESGVNDLLLSADAFHQETIPLEAVLNFGQALIDEDVPVRISPAWLGGRGRNNPYNQKTEEVIARLAAIGIPIHEGNDIFPEGNARIYLAEYFNTDEVYENPYAENPFDLGSVSIEPDGTLLYGNIHEKDVMTIFNEYRPDLVQSSGRIT